MFQTLQRSQGKTIAGDTGDHWQMDLIDLKQDPAINKLGEQENNILVLINVFDRSLYAMPLTGKDVKTVRGALIRLLDQVREKPKIISVDAGKEFEGRVASLMVQRGIALKTKAVGDKNALGVIDKTSQTLKQILARLMAEEGSDKNWLNYLKKAVVAYNSNYHTTVHAAPKDVSKDENAQFMTLQDNARKIQHNIKLTDARKDKLESAGAFRAPIPGSEKKFARSYQAKYGQVEKIQKIDGTMVTGNRGTQIDIKRVQSVPLDSNKAAQGRFGLNRALPAKKKDIVKPIEDKLYEWRGTDDKSLTASANFLRANVEEYDHILYKAKPTLGGVVRASDRLEQIQNKYYVRRKGIWSSKTRMGHCISICFNKHDEFKERIQILEDVIENIVVSTATCCISQMPIKMKLQ